MPAASTLSDSPLNVLWLCTDQQRYDTIHSLGNDLIRTPHLDSLVRTGVSFTQAFCQSPVCTPSRASFLTGRYPRTTRCRQNGQTIPEDEVLISRMSADAGYLSRYDPAQMPLPGTRVGEPETKTTFQQLDAIWAHNSPGEFHTAAMTDDDRRQVTAAYYAMCELIDDQVGRILQVLDETGQRENTVVIFMSDQGELYDLVADPDEFVNLWNSPAHQNMKLRLMKSCFDASVLSLDPCPQRRGPF
ncbi:MAG: sulfatase-like hydrolase/transferase [Fuerstiella sp.]